MTVALITICASIFLGNELAPKQTMEFLHGTLGVGDDRIYGGAVWGLLTSAFVHFEVFHIAFNMYWLWVIGSQFEAELGPWWLIAFVVLTAFVSSAIQLFLGTGGVGFSGAGYALFAFCYITRGTYRRFDIVACDQNAMGFGGWAVLCIVLTYAHVMNVGNGAHIGGAAIGLALGGLVVFPKERFLMAAAVGGLCAAAVVALMWNPNSRAWVAHRAIDAHKAGKWARAESYYRRYEDLGGDIEWADANIAEMLGQQQSWEKYRVVLERIRLTDPETASELDQMFPKAKSTR